MKKDLQSERSHNYQASIMEIVCDHENLAQYSNAQGLGGYLAQYQHTEEVAELYDQVKVELWKLVDSKLTAHQSQILHLTADGYTQVEISKMLGIQQSGISKSLLGNLVYKNGKRVYQHHQGGALKKIRNAVQQSAKIQDLLSQIRDLQEEGY